MPFPNPATQFKQGDDKVTNVEFKRKGGRVRSDKKKIAAKLRTWKKYGVKDYAAAERMMLLLEDPSFALMDYRKTVDEIEKIAKNIGDPKLLEMAGNQKAKWAKLAHGEKHKIEATHHVAVWDMMSMAYQKVKQDGSNGDDGGDSEGEECEVLVPDTV